MLIVKITILTAGAVVLIAPTITSSSLKRIRRGNGDCYDKTVHLAFEKAEKTCFDKAVTDKTRELGEQNYDAAEVEEKFVGLLDYYHTEKQRDAAVLDTLKTTFEHCFLQEARDGLSMQQEAFAKKYQNNVLRMLETVSNPGCKAKYAEENVLDDNFIKEKREQWDKLGMFRRAIKTAMGNFVTFANPKLKECLGNMDEVTLPQLLCAVEGKEAPILEKMQCYEELMNPNEPTTKKTASEDKPPRTLIRLGFFSKYVVDKFICANIDKQHNVKQNLKGAAKIIAKWPFYVIASVVAIPYVALAYYVVWCWGKACEGKWYFACAGGFGLAAGAVLGVCLLLYSVFGIPWKALSRIFSYDANSNKFDFAEELGDEWLGKAFKGLSKAGRPKKKN